jgi:3-phenylpropionate/trans-cinnamate dioxygenase ferredoxin subunit
MSGNWTDAGPTADLPDGESRALLVGRCAIAVARSGTDFFAVADLCTHDGADLAGGAVENGQIICPRHGARFCLRTGAALTPPAYEAIPVYETKIADGRLWVRSG